jgi:hypothetical protein
MLIEIWYVNENDTERKFLFTNNNPKTLQEFHWNYTKVYSISIVKKRMKNDTILNNLYERFNTSANPLSTPDSQQMLRAENVRHTSMSMGDIIKINSSYFIVRSIGFKKLKL